MWQYFGTKLNKARYYPRPVYDTIIEPFAGAAGYSLQHYKKKVVLIEKSAQVVHLWRWLQQCESDDLLRLPIYDLRPGLRLDSLGWPCEPARELARRVMFFGWEPSTNFVPPSFDQKHYNRMLQDIRRIAHSLYKIKGWRFILGDYHAIANIEATWFIDPPYQYGGEHYHHGNKELDYDELARWCRSRRGQVIVCENTKANWLPFLSMGKVKSKNNFNEITEALWSNRPTVYDATQERLF